MKEIAVMKKLNHENIVRLHEVIDDDEGDKIYMGMYIYNIFQMAETQSSTI